MPSPYERYAAIYDATGQAAFSQKAWRIARRVLAEQGWQGRDVLELACGTGVAAAAMRQDGYRVVGLDLARGMLLEALPRALEAGFGLVRGDMRELPFADVSFDLACAWYDSVNYLLTSSDLARLLTGVGRVLRPGGMLVFDLNTPHTLQHHWTGVCTADLGDERPMIWRAEWVADREVSSLRAAFFVRGADGRYDRFDEVHDEHGFEPAEIAAAGEPAGLMLAHSEDLSTGRRPGRSSRRVLYALRKRGR